METCPSGLRCDVGSVVWLIPTMSSNLIVSAIADNSSSELFFYEKQLSLKPERAAFLSCVFHGQCDKISFMSSDP